MTTTPSLGRSSFIMASGTFVSRILGLVRNLILVAAIGVNVGAANAFDVANKVPNVMYAILASGMLNAVLVPQIVRAYQRNQGEEFTNRVLTVAGAIMLGVTFLFTLGSSWVISLYIDNWTPELTALAVSFGFWCIPQLFFYGLYTLLGQVLNARSIFGPFMWAPVVNNIISIVGFSIFIAIFGGYDAATAHDLSSWTGPKIALLAGSATLGIVGQALILIWPLYKSGFRFRMSWKIRGMGMRSMGKVAAWTTLATVLEQIGVLVITRITSAAGEHAGELLDVAGNAAYTQALMIYLLPHSLVSVSITTALFTQLSAAAAAGDMNKVRADLSLGMRTVGVFTVFATVALIVLAVPITRVILFTASHPGEITSVARVLSVMAIGLVPLGGMLLIRRAYFAFEEGFAIFVIQLPVTAITIGGSLAGMYFLTPDWWAAAAGGSMALGSMVAGAQRLGELRRRLNGLDGRRILRLYVRLIISALAAGVVGHYLLSMWGAGADDPIHGLKVGVIVGVIMLAIYLLGLKLMRVQELKTLLSPVTAKLRRR